MAATREELASATGGARCRSVHGVPVEVHLLQTGLDGLTALPRVGARRDLRHVNIGPVLPLPLSRYAEPAVPGADEIFVCLPVAGQPHHQLWDAVGKIVAVILRSEERRVGKGGRWRV